MRVRCSFGCQNLDIIMKEKEREEWLCQVLEDIAVVPAVPVAAEVLAEAADREAPAAVRAEVPVDSGEDAPIWAVGLR